MMNNKRKSTTIVLASMMAVCLSSWADVKQDFIDPPLKVRPRPLWFWNHTTVTPEEAVAQMQACRDKSGYGGLAPLPFGKNFMPKYLSDEYFALYGTVINKARELGMFLTVYDEYGFPSGSGGAMGGDGIPRLKNKYPDATLKRLDKHEEAVVGPASYSKTLPAGRLMSLVAMNSATLERVDLTEKVREGNVTWSVPAGSWKIMSFVCVPDGDPNVDYLEPDHVAKYIEMVYQPYYDRFGKDFGKTIGGAFFDEPTLYRAQGRVWTERFNEKFKSVHGFNPAPYYPALWYDIGAETQAARNALFGFRTELYAKGYMKTVQDWCTAHGGIALLGHQDQENVKNPVGVSGDLMKCYQYQEVPGIDKIGWGNDPEGYYKVISSAVYNWDKREAMTETYGAMGNLSWSELYAIVMEQYAKGINNFVAHAVWYDVGHVTYKPEFSWRNTLYADGLYAYNTYIARLNVLLQAPGRHVADIAVLYPIATLQAGHTMDGHLGSYLGGVTIPEADYIHVGELLATQLCRDFTFLHPDVLDVRCAVKGSTLKLKNKINYEDYSVVIIPGHKTIRWSNLKRIKEFYDKGGRVIATGQLPSKSAEFGHDADVVAAIKELFPKVEEQRLATASTERQNSGSWEPANAFDNDAESYWSPVALASEKNKWWLQMDFGREQTFNTTVIKEAQSRVTAYTLQYWNNTEWVTCATGGTIGTNKVDTFNAVTARRLRLAISGVSSDIPSIAEMDVRLNGGPNLANSDRLIVHAGRKGGRTIYLDSLNKTSLRRALDEALDVYDVEVDESAPLRYIHRVTAGVDVFFFANISGGQVSTTLRLLGKFTPEVWNPHTGECSRPEFTHTQENGQAVTCVKLSLNAVQSRFIVAR